MNFRHRCVVRGHFLLAGILPVVLLSSFPAELTAQQLTPSESLKAMSAPADVEVQLVASEPLVRQPVCIEHDDRGRLWVIQYLQYPNPEGLTRVAVDRFSRTRYDRVPEPPPHGPRGADRITILKDTDGDGIMDAGHDFVDGLNLTTGLAFGHGGVFVLNVPYLLFYPDRNRDDVPDSDPEVLLTGFGMEDAHSVANSLTWGPDGWLYGCQGSTVTASIRGIEFQQGVWRYHPTTKEFELFCEGGGNSWGLDFDATGRLFYSTNYGGHVLLHGLQGGNFVKSFAKHGALHNPHAYGYFDHAPHASFKGGHVTVGGIVYQGDAFPESLRGKYVAGDLLGHGVYWHNITPRGTTVQTSHGGELLQSSHSWFAPTDVTMGPDGAIYVTDWHDARTAHPDPDADWDRSNGRIYRIAPKSHPRRDVIDFATLSVDELLKLHDHSSQWFVRHARQELVRRADISLQPALLERAERSNDEHRALEALWTLASLGLMDETLAMKLLESPHAAVRSWTVRTLGDTRTISEQMAHRMDEFAEQELSPEVRQQLACSAARWPPKYAVPMINANINRDIDNADPCLPLLWWWAVERHSVTGREEVMKRFVRPSLWNSQLGRDFLLTRLVRRYAAEGTVEGMDCVSRLLAAAPNDSAKTPLWESVLLGWREASTEKLATLRKEAGATHPLLQQILATWQARPTEMTLHQLAILAGHTEPVTAAMQEVLQDSAVADRRIALMKLLGESVDADMLPSLLSLVKSNAPEAVRAAAIQLVARQEGVDISQELIDVHQAEQSETIRSRIRGALLSRRSSAAVWLKAVESGHIKATATPLEEIRLVALFGDAELDAIVVRHWGRVQAATPEEKLAEVRRLNNDLRAGSGDPTAGRLLFMKHCSTCHQLFGEGIKLGPDLTTANRADRDFLLISLVDPGSVIRKEFVSVIVQTRDGRTETGLPVARDESGITLVTSKNERIAIAESDIEELRESTVSHMPEGLYRQFKPQELRDLFAWLQSTSGVR
jgi:putative membrane-bound dehydrogenase-like protein